MTRPSSRVLAAAATLTVGDLLAACSSGSTGSTGAPGPAVARGAAAPGRPPLASASPPYPGGASSTGRPAAFQAVKPPSRWATSP